MSEREGTIPGTSIKWRLRKLADYRQNPTNPVGHPERNRDLVAQSIQKFGALRSGVSSDGQIIGGNLTWEAMKDAGVDDVLEVATDGHEWVMVERPDLTPEQRQQAAYYDQQASQLATWDATQIAADLEKELELGDVFTEVDLAAFTDMEGGRDDRTLMEFDAASLPDKPVWCLCTIKVADMPKVAPILTQLTELGVWVELSNEG